MATIIAFNNSSSMMRRTSRHCFYGEEQLNYLQLAKIGIKQLLQHISILPLEYISLVTFSSKCETVVDFTRDYEQIRLAVEKVHVGEATDVVNLLRDVVKLMSPHWGKQCPQKICIFTDDTGIVEISQFLIDYSYKEQNLCILEDEENNNDYSWVEPLRKIKINFILLGLHQNADFQRAIAIYKELIFFLGLRGQLFLPKPFEFLNKNIATSSKNTQNQLGNNNCELGRNEIFEVIEHVDQCNYKPFETLLKIGDPCRTEAHIIIWPAAMPHIDENGVEVQHVIDPVIFICGYILKSDIGFPETLSHHLILSKNTEFQPETHTDCKNTNNENTNNFANQHCRFDPCYFAMNDAQNESIVVLLYSALKANNYYALVLIHYNWFGLIYPYTDSNNKEALMLMVLPPGNNVIPWIGDFRQLITFSDAVTYFNSNMFSNQYPN